MGESGKENEYLLAAIPGAPGGGRERLGNASAEMPKNGVAGGVSVVVVESFEMIDVDHRDADGLAGKKSSLEKLTGSPLEKAARPQAGERVALGEIAQATTHSNVGYGEFEGFTKREHGGLKSVEGVVADARREVNDDES